MKSIWQRFNDTPIFFRLSFITIFVIIVLVIFSYSNYTNFTREKEYSAVDTVEQANNQALDIVDGYLMDISNITKIPLTYRTADENYMGELNRYNQSDKSTLSFQKMNEQMFEEIMAYKPNIDSCYIFNLHGNGDYKVRTPIYAVMNPTEEQWFESCIEEFGNSVIVDTYELPFIADNKGPMYAFGIARGIVRIESGAVIGVLLVNVKTDYLKGILENVKITENHRVLIINNDKTIYDTLQGNIGKEVDDTITGINWNKHEKLNIVNIDGERMLVSSTISDYSGWRIISLVPLDELLADLQMKQGSILLFTIILIIITLLLLFAIIIRIVRPIKRLEAIMRLAENGKFDIQVQDVGKDEIGSLSRSFNAMITQINSLINEVYIEKINQSQLELQMLQAQINPHFLYNTLESISMMAVINDDETTSDMAANLGAILRYGISNYDKEVSLGEEILNLEKYIELQEIRFNSIYAIRICIDPVLYSVRMIKLILQPIVENAVYHGMSQTRSGGEITITAAVIHKKIIEFKITDNGVGMEEERLKNLNEYIQGENDLFSSIGLRNVNKRIKLRYGEEFGVTIASKFGMGTIVSATIPFDTARGNMEGAK